MKYNFRKISAIAMSVMTLGLTAGVAPLVSGADYPAPFVDNGSADFAVVHGSGAAATDQAEATSVANSLLALASGGVSGVGTDSIQLQRSSDEFNLGNNMTDFYTTLDDEELSVVLENGIYFNDENDDFDYEQELTLPSTSQLTHFRDRDYNDYEPTIGFHLAKGDAILNYTLEFTPNAVEAGSNYDDLESTFIEILGKEYFISEVSNDGTSITLLDSASTTLLNQGDTTTVTVDGTSYEVSIQAISGTGAILVVDGESTNRLGDGDTQKLSGGNVHIGVTDFQEAAFQGDNAFVEFSLGSGEIVIENGVEVEINGDAISQIDEYDGHKLNGYTLSNPSNETIILEWLADDDVFITQDSELTLPGFGGVKFTMGDFVTDTEETTTFNTGDPFSITTTVEDGEVTLDIFYLNGTEDGFGTNLGASSVRHLITNQTGGTNSTVELNLDNETYFVASWTDGSRDAETYVYELSNIKDNSGKNETTLTSLSGGSNVVFSDTTDDQDVGRLRLTLTASDVGAETATVKVEAVSSGSVYTDRVFTAEGLQFKLPVIDGANTTENFIFLDSNVTFDFNFTEEDRDGNIASGSSFQISTSIDSDDGIEADGETGVGVLQIGRTGDNYVGYVESDLATRVDWTKDTSGLDAMQVTYHGSEAYAEVFVSSTDATDDGSIELGDVLVTDSEVSSVQNRNLVVIGGSCINSVAANLVGGAYCGSAWTDATGVGSGEFVIESFENPNNDDAVALLVAGYERDDTVNAATYLRQQGDGLNVDVGEKYTGSTSTSVEAVVN
ncbi:MAG: hypothetical protein WDZ62_01835 [Candidatus Pacearchaeota archaeon]